MKQALKSLIIFGGVAAVLLLGFGITLVALTQPATSLILPVHQEYDFVEEGPEKYLDYTLICLVTDHDRRLTKTARVYFSANVNGASAWSCEKTIENGKFFLHIFIPYSELNIETALAVEAFDIDCRVIEQRTGGSC